MLFKLLPLPALRGWGGRFAAPRPRPLPLPLPRPRPRPPTGYGLGAGACCFVIMSIPLKRGINSSTHIKSSLNSSVITIRLCSFAPLNPSSNQLQNNRNVGLQQAMKNSLPSTLQSLDGEHVLLFLHSTTKKLVSLSALKTQDPFPSLSG